MVPPNFGRLFFFSGFRVSEMVFFSPHPPGFFVFPVLVWMEEVLQWGSEANMGRVSDLSGLCVCCMG